MQTLGNRQLLAGAGGLAAAIAAAAALQRRHTRRITADPEDAALRAPPHGRPLEIESTDGTRLHAEVFGPERAQTIVLAHGWTESIPYWTYVIGDLSGRFRVIAYDLRGHGHSQPAADGDYAIARFGEDLEAVLEASLAADERAVVVGHSLGAMSIAAWAEQYDVERRVSAVALLNTGVGDSIAESVLMPVPRVAQLLNRTLPPSSFLGSRAPLPRFRHRSATRRSATSRSGRPRRPRRSLSTNACSSPALPTCAPTWGSPCPSSSSTTRCRG